jgi:hypothetical protein
LSHSTAGQDEAKIFFRLDVEDDWPPIAVESMWAERLGDGLFRLDNVPLFAEDANADDIIRAEIGDQGVLEFQERVESDGQTTVRVIAASEVVEAVLEFLLKNGAEYETSPYEDIGYFSVSVPPDADWAKVEAYLSNLEDSGVLSWGATF